MLSTPADFLFFNDCTAASTSLRRIGWSSSVSVWGQSSTDGSPLVLWLYSSVQYSVIGSIYLVLLWGISLPVLDSSSFSLFHSGQVFHELVCPLTVVLQIFFNLTTLFPYPVLFSFFHASLDVVVHFLVFRITHNTVFRSELSIELIVINWGQIGGQIHTVPCSLVQFNTAFLTMLFDTYRVNGSRLWGVCFQLTYALTSLYHLNGMRMEGRGIVNNNTQSDRLHIWIILSKLGDCFVLFLHILFSRV